MEKGIIVAATHHIEWMLPWWWYNYQAHNNLPVVFFDLGLSQKAKDFCSSKGLVLPLEISDSLVFGKEQVSPATAHLWEKIMGSGIWDIRLKWFKKPYAFLASPFDQTLWLDLDCEVRASLTPLFAFAENPLGLSMTREPEPLQQGFRSLGILHQNEVLYNSGVVPFCKNTPILSLWVKEVETNNHAYIGDQEALSRLLFLQKSSFPEIPSLYNLDRGLGPNSEAFVFHWHGQQGKALIKEQMQALSSLGFLQN